MVLTAPTVTAGYAPAVRAQLRRLAVGLGTADPVDLLGPAADRVLAQPSDRLAANTLEAGRRPVEYSFAESDPELLRVVLDTFDHGFIGVTFRSRGPVEVKTYVRASGDSQSPLRVPLPVGAEQLLLGLSVCAGGRIAVRYYFRCTEGLAPLELGSLLSGVGLAPRLPELVLRAAELTGGRLILPSRTVVVAVRMGAAGQAFKLELMGSARAPDLRGPRPAVLANLDPATRPAFERWYGLVRDVELGYTEVAVISIGDIATSGSRLTVYVRSRPLELP